MQSKVSMVMPCYNKVEHISKMFDSILTQIWNNIEIIIVNDGSTDGTREVIADYALKLKQRGYELVIIDQENQGVATALLNGLKKVSGDYVCTVDCDDILHREYVSAMADCLDKHMAVNRVVCDHSGSQWRMSQSRGLTKKYYKEIDIFECPIYESQLLFRVAPTCCTNMVRRSYLSEGDLSSYSTLCHTSQEPGFNAIINKNNEPPIYIHRVLYNYVYHNESITSYKGSREQLEKHYDNYIKATEESIRLLGFLDEDQNRLIGCAKVGMCWHINAVHSRTEEPAETLRKNNKRIISVARQYFSDIIKADEKQLEHTGFKIFHRALSNRIIGLKSRDVTKLNYNRIIAYGHGRAGQKLLPLLVETNLKPTVIWDKNATNRYSFDDVPIRKPDLDNLSDEDMVLVLISDLTSAEEVYDSFEGDTRENLLPYSDLLDYLGDFYFK